MAVAELNDLESGDRIELVYLSVYNNKGQNTRSGEVIEAPDGDPQQLVFDPDGSNETMKVVGGKLKIADAPVYGKRADRVIGHGVRVSREKAVAGGH